MNKTPEEIKNSVLEKIRHGDVHMRPRVYFVTQVIAVIVVAVLALVASSLAISFALFSIHESGEQFLLGFGSRGLLMFFTLFPWFAAIIAIALIFLFEALLRHFKFNYRRSILNIFFAFVGIAILGGLLISFTPLHNTLLNKADKGELPIIGDLYENVRMPHEDQGEFRGVIISVGTSTLTITHNDNDADVDDGTRTVTVPRGVDMNQFHVGDRIYVAGEMASGTVEAYGLKPF